jgi:hypothetical protein
MMVSARNRVKTRQFGRIPVDLTALRRHRGTVITPLELASTVDPPRELLPFANMVTGADFGARGAGEDVFVFQFGRFAAVGDLAAVD